MQGMEKILQRRNWDETWVFRGTLDTRNDVEY